MLRNSIWRVVPLIFALCMVPTQTPLAESDSKSDEQLHGSLNYWFVGHLGQTDNAGRLLVWEADVDGDFTGRMKWWFEIPPPLDEIKYQGGRLTFYAARWELWDDGKLLLAGDSAGKTNFVDGADGIWDGHGRVKIAVGRYEFLKDRLVYETGPVILGSDPPKTYTGTGLFLVY